MIKFLVGFLLGLIVGAAEARASCLVVGDSIAQAVAPYLPQCDHSTKIGIGSAAVAERTKPGYDVVIVSAGSNDPTNPKLLANLEAIHAKGGSVIWIAPVNVRARTQVILMGLKYNETVLAFDPGPDHVHPASPRGLAAALQYEMATAYAPEPTAPVLPPSHPKGTDI